jgi:hypothetical protein
MALSFDSIPGSFRTSVYGSAMEAGPKIHSNRANTL